MNINLIMKINNICLYLFIFKNYFKKNNVFKYVIKKKEKKITKL